MWYMYTHICTHTHSANLKKTEILPFETTWMDLKDIMLSERSQTEKRKTNIS